MVANPRHSILFAVLTSFVLAAGCGGDEQCSDGVDNDADGLIDSNDPGCAVNGDAEFPEPPQCNDTVDNDSDGLIDGADPGCSSIDDNDEFNEPIAQCKDGLDNDGDGFNDFPNDPGCTLSVDDEEVDDCPGGETCPACGNGMDDDSDGLTDYPEDPGCSNAGDSDEFNADPTICGASVPVYQLPADGVAMGTISPSGSNDLISLDCGGNGTEVAYEFTLNEDSALTITTDFEETTADTVVYLRGECREPDTEIACSDDEGASTASSLQIDNLAAGTYYLVVDSASEGEFKLVVDGFAPEGGPCDPMDSTPCPPGLVCRSVDGSAPETCELPECKDGEDNLDSEDSVADYPDDPGCQTPEDNDEEDPTPLPECSNGMDDDEDGTCDYTGCDDGGTLPADPGCESAGDDLELECEDESDPVNPIASSTTTGTTSGLTDDLSGSCSSFGSAPDVVYTLSVPGELATLTVDTIGSDLDTVIYIKADDCAATDIECDDEGGPSFGESLIELSDVAAGIYLIVVDGYSSNSGDYTLNVVGEIKSGEACDAQAEMDGYLVCESGFACVSGTCQQAQCNDGTDNDTDGDIDWPNDPGCSTPSDADEGDESCPGGGCPDCANGMDDDGDGFTDYDGDGGQPDPGCNAAGDDDEADECVPGVPVVLLENPPVTSTTPPLSAGSDFQGSCNSASSPEEVYVFNVPANLASLTFTTTTPTSSDDTVLYVREGDCGDSGAEVACQNDQSGGESVTLTLPDAGFYYIFVDGDYDSAVDYDLTYNGILFAGGPCGDDPNFTCPVPQTCQGNPGNQTCQNP